MKNPRIPDLSEFLPYLLNQAAESASADFRKLYNDKYGMLRTEWRILFHLGQYGALTATDIGKRARMHKTKISRGVAALEKKRFLKRKREENDRRKEFLSLTGTGQKIYRELSESAAYYDTNLVEWLQLSTPEERKLRDILKKLARKTG